jgi:hypothetical protein
MIIAALDTDSRVTWISNTRRDYRPAIRGTVRPPGVGEKPPRAGVLSKINLPVVALVLPHLAVAADNTAARPVEIAVSALPTVSIESMCSDAQWAGLGESSSSEYEGRIRDERSAFEQLR